MWTNTEEFHNNKDTEDSDEDDGDASVIFAGNYIKIQVEGVSDIKVCNTQMATYKVDNCAWT